MVAGLALATHAAISRHGCFGCGSFLASESEISSSSVEGCTVVPGQLRQGRRLCLHQVGVGLGHAGLCWLLAVRLPEDCFGVIASKLVVR